MRVGVPGVTEKDRRIRDPLTPPAISRRDSAFSAVPKWAKQS